jgi:hypothetical protein
MHSKNFCAEKKDMLMLSKHTAINLVNGDKSSELVIHMSGNKDKKGNLRRFDMHLVHLNKNE